MAMNPQELAERLAAVYRRQEPPETEELLPVAEAANATLESEGPDRRPYDGQGLPGGLVRLDEGLPTVLLPDLHARMEFLLTVLLGSEIRALERMSRGELQVICVGDAFHGEARVAPRWFMALREYLSSFRYRAQMDQEMRESLGVLEMVMLLKSFLPRSFHFLKGNHENIANEQGRGNHPFIKFVDEGAMVTMYVRRFLGRDFLETAYRYEHALPLLAVGNGFLVSHAEPRRVFRREEVIEYRRRDEVVEGLTWTDNGEAEPGSVRGMLEHFLDGDPDRAFYFGGHRPVTGLYATRAGGRYVQFHNPGKQVVVLLEPGREVDLDRDVREIEVDRSIPALSAG